MSLCKDFSPFMIERVIDGSEKVPISFAPLARGMAIVSDFFFKRAPQASFS